MPKERVIVYIDGFNLYFGMVQAGIPNTKWLDVKSLAEDLLTANQELVGVQYYTSRVSNNAEKQKRQTTYLEAIESTGVDIFYGQYQSNTIKCNRCPHEWVSYNEKMTDVNIAVDIIMDGINDKYDAAMLISGDSDLVPPIRAVINNFLGKRVFVAFPPMRQNNTVKLAAKGCFVIGKRKIQQNQLPNAIKKLDGYVLTKPKEWVDGLL